MLFAPEILPRKRHHPFCIRPNQKRLQVSNAQPRDTRRRLRGLPRKILCSICDDRHYNIFFTKLPRQFIWTNVALLFAQRLGVDQIGLFSSDQPPIILRQTFLKDLKTNVHYRQLKNCIEGSSSLEYSCLDLTCVSHVQCHACKAISRQQKNKTWQNQVVRHPHHTLVGATVKAHATVGAQEAHN